MEPRTLLCQCRETPFGPLIIPMAGPLPPQYPILPALKSLQSWETGMETGQWELGEMTWPLPESHPILKQPGPHSIEFLQFIPCFGVYVWKLPSLPAKWVGIYFVLKNPSILIFSIKMLCYSFCLLLLQVGLCLFVQSWVDAVRHCCQ